MKQATREAFGATLAQLAAQDRNIVVLDADLGGSTMGKMFEQRAKQSSLGCGASNSDFRLFS